MPSSEDQSLASLLNLHQRRDLATLIGSATGQMRTTIIRGFEHKEPSPQKQSTEHSKTSNQNIHPSDQQSSPMKGDTSDHSNLSSQEFHKLQSAALAFFDTWRDKVILRVGEVLTSEDKSTELKDPSHTQEVANAGKEEPPSSPGEKAANEGLAAIYPPVSTPLANLSFGERITVLNAILLLLLSLESYTAHSRTLLLRLASSLHIPVARLTKMEKDIAVGLLTAASHMDASSSTSAAQQANATARKWKVGLASVAGAALIGITGGLAAPLVAAGVGGLMGGLGLGATAAAGYLGTLAGSSVLVGGLFGAYGGKMTGQMMDEYAREVEDFAFLPLAAPDKNRNPIEYARERREGHHDEAEKERRRLRITVGISGWLTSHSEVWTPWYVVGDGGEPFALQWEVEVLVNLGRAIQGAVESYAWSYIKVELLKRTVLAGLMAATWPLAFLKFSKVLDNPFSIAKSRADKAGAILADALIKKAQGERPVSLVGYSLGGRVIYTCLKTLAERKAFGLVDSVVFMGAPMPSDSQDWKLIRSVVSGRLVNVYSEKDYILGFLYRTSSIQFGVAGLQAVEGVHGIENVDVSESVTGHLRYRYMVGQLLRQIGWADLDEKALEKEHEALKKLKEEEEKREREARQKGEVEGGKTDEKQAEEDGAKLEQELATKMTLADKGGKAPITSHPH
jgi:Protein of unknown function (DUF726)